MGRNTKHKGLREAIIYNETKHGTPEYKTAEMLAAEFSCTKAYIYRVRYLLGFKVPSLKLKDPPPSAVLSESTTETGALSDLLNEPLISPLDRLKMLSRLIRTGAPAVKIAAIKAYEELTRTSDNRVGPGTPLTDDERVTRLAKLLMAVSPQVAADAWEVAFGLKVQTAPTRSPLPTNQKAVPSASKPVEQQLYDLPIPTYGNPLSSGGPQPSDEEGPGPAL